MFGKGKTGGAEATVPTIDAPVRPKITTAAVTSILSSDLKIVGDIVSAGDLQFDGEIEGNVQAKRLTVGKDGVIKGSVRANEIVVLGRIEGSVCGERVDLKTGCTVIGDVANRALAIEAGAKFSGRADHSDNPMAANNARVMPSPGLAAALATAVPQSPAVQAEARPAVAEPVMMHEAEMSSPAAETHFASAGPSPAEQTMDVAEETPSSAQHGGMPFSGLSN